MPEYRDLAEGERFLMQGSGSKPYVLSLIAGVYSCSCPAWCNQSKPIEQRTCKHLTKLRGQEAETARVGSAVAAPIRPAGDKEAPPVLLAETWDTVTNLAGWWMSEKLDGVRAYWDGKKFWSRQGNEYFAPDWFVAGLPPVPLDGELWIGRKAFQRTVSIARRGDKSDHWRELRYLVYDAPTQAGEFEVRMEHLRDLLHRNRPEFAELLPQERCRDLDHLRDELARLEALGAEGLMLRQPGSLYIAGRSATLLKVKSFLDGEAVVVGHDAGKGRHKGRLGALVCKLPDGTLFSVGTGFSDAQRESPPPIGTTITFRYQELSDGGVPRFPSYGGLRRDGGSSALPQTPVIQVSSTTVSASVSATPPGPGSPPVAASPAPSTTPPPAPAPTEGLTRRFAYVSNTTSRFWEVTRRGRELTLRFGATGTVGQTKVQSFASEAEASAAAAELIAEKLEDDFVELTATAAPPQSPAAVSPPQAAAAPAPAPAKAPAKAAPVQPSTTPAASPGARHFTFVEGNSSKFWEVSVSGNQVTTRYGRIGSDGQQSVKGYPDEAAARKAADKLIAEKTGKGYSETQG